MQPGQLAAHHGQIVHCRNGSATGLQMIPDGMLLVQNGKVVEVGPAKTLAKKLSEDVTIIDHGEQIICPGFIDCHVHFPQLDVIASYGAQLLDWLETYTFPTEARYADADIAEADATFFIDELLRNGTTSALVFATVHATSVDAIFNAALKRNMRLAAGKVLMDRNCPANLQDTPASAYGESRALVEKWHKQDRMHYAITPRFAVTSSNAQLAAAGQLAQEFPDTLIHTHLSENLDEVAWIAELFPEARSYLDVYAQNGLLRERSVFAHCVHLEEHDYQEFHQHGGGMAFCPSSNLFLGSGLFDLKKARDHHIRVGLGTDVGGGTSFSLLQTINAAYKVLQLQKQSLDSGEALYLATLGGAQTLGIDDKVGNFEPGKEADFVILDNTPTPLLSRRLANARTQTDALFMHMILGDDRSISETYVMGERVYQKQAGK
jgi:guanine deaminase